MAHDLFKVIESDQVAAEFYLASDTDWLCRWIERLPAVAELEDLVASDPLSADLLASHTLELFRAPVAPGCRSEHEPALCCYAFVLSHTDGSRARDVLNELNAKAGPSHGWLRRLLDRCQQDASAADRLVETHVSAAT
jgi:hypothetical protein